MYKYHFVSGCFDVDTGDFNRKFLNCYIRSPLSAISCQKQYIRALLYGPSFNCQSETATLTQLFYYQNAVFIDLNSF